MSSVFNDRSWFSKTKSMCTVLFITASCATTAAIGLRFFGNHPLLWRPWAPQLCSATGLILGPGIFTLQLAWERFTKGKTHTFSSFKDIISFHHQPKNITLLVERAMVFAVIASLCLAGAGIFYQKGFFLPAVSCWTLTAMGSVCFFATNTIAFLDSSDSVFV